MTTVRQSKGHDVVLNDGKLVIPRDVPIFMPIGALHRSHAVFDKADQFIPERWLRADADYLSGMYTEVPVPCCMSQNSSS